MKENNELAVAGVARARSIRWHLFQVLLVTIVPVGLFAAGLLYLHWKAQERERERSQIESARLLATTVDNALETTVQRLQLFARLWGASRADDRLMHAYAREALAANPDWSNLIAFRADGPASFIADQPFGKTLPTMKLFEVWGPVVTERRPVVSDLFVSPTRRMRMIAVGVPVIRDGKVTHVLIANLNLRWYDQLLTRQGLIEGGVAGIFDRHWKFVARGSEGEERRGTDGAAPLVEDMKRKPEGIGRYASLSGTPVYTSWAPTRHGWWVAIATPAEPVEAAFRRYLLLFGLLWAAITAGGIFFALLKGRRIAGGLASLAEHAQRLAGGSPPAAIPPSDVAELDRALDALARAGRTLEAATQERDRLLETEREGRAAAEAASRAKDEFLAMLGHELRNPLAAIANAATIVKSERHTREQLDFAAGVIARQSRHLKRLIDDLLDVGRVMTGKVGIEREALDLAASARHVAATLETAGRLAERRVEVVVEPAWISGDHTRIEQIITNLLVNAATYTAPGGRIRLRVAREDGAALVEVSDDGVGIAAESLPRVFELFYQADPTVDRSGGGLGIGLTLVQRLAQLHGGAVEAKSEGKGRGATFTVRFPGIAAPARGAPAMAFARPAVAHTVMLVEDNRDARASLRMTLELQGHRVLEAADGKAAIELLNTYRPAVAIVDIGLPGMDGYQVAAAARAALGRGILLIAVTGYGSAEDERRARDAGFDRHITKPADEHVLAQAIQAARPPLSTVSPSRAA